MTLNPNSTIQHPAPIPLKILVLLLCASFFASISTIFYGLTVTQQTIAWPGVLGVASGLIVLVTSPLASLGLWLRNRLGIEAARIKDFFIKDRWLLSLFLAIGFGLLCGIFVALSDKAFYSSLPTAIQEMKLPGSFSGLFAAFGAGINEEIWFRLGLLTGLVSVGRWIFKDSQTSLAVFWTANSVTALLFGAAHLPQFALIASELPFSLIAVVLLQNGGVGLIFGWLYWQWGLLAAILAHITADLVIHVFVPMFLS